MTVVQSGTHAWQSLDHRIELCGASTGHAVRTVALCDSTRDAAILVGALAALKAVYDDHFAKKPHAVQQTRLGVDVIEKVRTLLDQAGLCQ